MKKGAKTKTLTHRWNNTGYFVLPLSSMFGGRNSTAFNSEPGKRSKYRKKATNIFLTISFTLNSGMNDGRRCIHMHCLVQRLVGHQQTRIRYKSPKSVKHRRQRYRVQPTLVPNPDQLLERHARAFVRQQIEPGTGREARGIV